MKFKDYEIKIGEPFDHRDGTEYVVDVFLNEKEVGYFKFNHWPNHPNHGEILHVMEAEVHPTHRRKGIATFVYDVMEEHCGAKIHHEPDQQTNDAKSFWKNRLNR